MWRASGTTSVDRGTLSRPIVHGGFIDRSSPVATIGRGDRRRTWTARPERRHMTAPALAQQEIAVVDGTGGIDTVAYRRRPWPPDARAEGLTDEGSPVTRDDLIAWLLLPWNIVKAIALTAYWIIAALIRGGDDEEEEAFTAPIAAVEPRLAARERSSEPAPAPTASAEHRTPS